MEENALSLLCHDEQLTLKSTLKILNFGIWTRLQTYKVACTRTVQEKSPFLIGDYCIFGFPCRPPLPFRVILSATDPPNQVAAKHGRILTTTFVHPSLPQFLGLIRVSALFSIPTVQYYGLFTAGMYHPFRICTWICQWCLYILYIDIWGHYCYYGATYSYTSFIGC